ncbi:unnamed protein product, partial [Ectocarpus fasciculatus]
GYFRDEERDGVGITWPRDRALRKSDLLQHVSGDRGNQFASHSVGRWETGRSPEGGSPGTGVGSLDRVDGRGGRSGLWTESPGAIGRREEQGGGTGGARLLESADTRRSRFHRRDGAAGGLPRSSRFGNALGGRFDSQRGERAGRLGHRLQDGHGGVRGGGGHRVCGNREHGAPGLGGVEGARRARVQVCGATLGGRAQGLPRFRRAHRVRVAGKGALLLRHDSHGHRDRDDSVGDSQCDAESVLLLRHVRRGLVADGPGLHPRAARQRKEHQGGQESRPGCCGCGGRGRSSC